MNRGSRRQPGNQYHQYNTAHHGGTVYSAQGNQHINHTTVNTAARRRAYRGWTLLVMVLADGGFFWYGMLAYTGQPHNTGDLWRACVFIGLVATTGTVLRWWLRANR